MKCGNCGGEKWDVIAQVGAVQTKRCVACGNEEMVHVNLVLVGGEAPRDFEPAFNWTLEWLSKPSLEEVDLLRDAFPYAEGLTLAVMMRAAWEKRPVELGRHSKSRLEPLMSKLQSMNIKIFSTPASLEE